MTLLFCFPEQEKLGRSIGLEYGAWVWRRFPDGESYVRVDSDVKHREVIILCSLNQPDNKIMALVFLAQALKDIGARHITLVAPYLGYMRQDKRFKAGEAVTSDVFAALLSPYINKLITIDPHLHRHHALEEIYRCECRAITAMPLMTQWIKEHVPAPLLIGPDSESEQWVREVAEQTQAPYVILEKTRHGDRDVSIHLPDIHQYQGRTVVLLDDMISTAGTMIKTIGLLREQGFEGAICLATHGLFSGDAYERLMQAGAARVITSNTITHAANGIDVSVLLRDILLSRYK